MRIAVFSDIHGNQYATRAVLQAIREAGPFDAVVAAGDLVMGGSDPVACLDCLAEAGVAAVYGNTDAYVLRPDEVPNDEQHRSIWDRIRPAAEWVREKLSPAQMEWLGGLPFELRFSPSGNPADCLLVVHANPRNVELMIYPDPEGQKALWGEVRQPDDDPGLLATLDGVQAQTIAFGHFHFTHRRTVAGLNLVDVAPASMPAIDHDPRARYTIFTWERDGWEIERRWVDYPWRQETAALQESTMPFKEDFLKSFKSK